MRQSSHNRRLLVDQLASNRLHCIKLLYVPYVPSFCPFCYISTLLHIGHNLLKRKKSWLVGSRSITERKKLVGIRMRLVDHFRRDCRCNQSFENLYHIRTPLQPQNSRIHQDTFYWNARYSQSYIRLGTDSIPFQRRLSGR